jgi:tetratricopeptide (TPR) repeat protein
MKAIILILFILIQLGCTQIQKNTSDTPEVNALLRTITIDALKEKNFEQAKRSIDALIINNPKNWDFIQSAIISLPPELSMQTIEKALSIKSVAQSSEKLFALSKVFISYKKTKQALALINQSIKLDKNNLEARYWRARLQTVLKNYDKAELDFKFIVKRSPDNENYSSQYASFLQETKRYDEAQKILAKQKATPDSLFKRLVFALQNENTTLAKEIYQQLINLKVGDKETNHQMFLTAEAAYWLKSYSESEKYYKKVSGGEHYLDAQDMLALILFDDKRYDEAIEILHQLENAEKKYAIKAYRLESQIHKEQGNSDEAIIVLTRALQIIPNDPVLLYDRAMLFESQSKIDLLKKDLKQIISDDPKNYEAYNALGYSLADHDLELENAYEYIQKAIELDPENPAIIDSLGWVQYKLGQYESAANSFQKALNLDINDPELYIHYYKTLLELNKIEKAKELIINARELFPKNLALSTLKI